VRYIRLIVLFVVFVKTLPLRVPFIAPAAGTADDDYALKKLPV
jgi:hypothetical protein